MSTGLATRGRAHQVALHKITPYRTTSLLFKYCKLLNYIYLGNDLKEQNLSEGYLKRFLSPLLPLLEPELVIRHAVLQQILRLCLSGRRLSLIDKRSPLASQH